MDAEMTSNRLMLNALVMSAAVFGYDRDLMEKIIEVEKNINALEYFKQVHDSLQDDVFDGINDLCDAISIRKR